MMLTRPRTILLLFTITLFVTACTRNTIEFGDDPENSYTDLVFTDTVSVSLSTVLTDSFATNDASSLLVGRYSDPYLGSVSAKNFFQMTIPSIIPDIPATAQYDSLTFLFRPSDYYYGDTTLAQTFYVKELAEAITYSYNNSLYNTSSTPVKSNPLGSATIRLKPVADDSIVVKLDNALGAQLFAKLRDKSTDVTNAENFLNFFHGISLSTGANDTGAVYGLTGTAGSMIMRVHYHHTIPYPEEHYIDFTSLANTYSFNQILTDRTGTGIVQGPTSVTEISSLQTNNHSFLQAGTGMYLKMTFPTLKSILTTDKIIKLIKAELIIRPTQLSFDKHKYKLPASLYLAQTDASNIIGSAIADSTGSNVLYSSPVVDDLYGQNNYYRFNLTSYINQLLLTPGTSDEGFFVIYDASRSAMNIDRLVANNSLNLGQSTRLHLYMLIVNK